MLNVSVPPAISSPRSSPQWLTQLKPIEVKSYPSVPFLIKDIVGRYADKQAIVENDCVHTYQTFWEYTQTLLLNLLKANIGYGERVIVFGKASFRFIASVVAVWMARAVAMPLDDSIPIERMSIIIKAADIKYVILTDGNDDRVFQINSVIVLNAAQSFINIPHQSIVDIEHRTQSEDAAYIFATSGTTGAPKLILGNHNALSHFLSWQKQQFNIGPGDRCLLTTNVTFDVVLRDMFLALISGATLYISDKSNEEIFKLINQHKITYFHATPSKLLVWYLRHPCHPVSLDSVRWIFSAGEPLYATLVNNWYSIGFAGNFVNLYGPTETTLAKCFHIVKDHSNDHLHPVGRPLPHTEIYLIDTQCNPCNRGETGEIVIKTPYCTSGYIEPKIENIQKFLTLDNSVDKLYFTGDLGRFNEQGQLVLLGRTDDQVKIRGVRVELREIENQLNQHPEIICSKILVVGNDILNKQLVAFYCVQSTSSVEGSKLRQFLAKKLHKEIIPSHFVPLSHMPLNKNGKVDKSKLRASFENYLKAQTIRTSENCTPNILSDIIQSILGVLPDINDSLFEAGFDSLMALVLTLQINERFGIDLTFSDLASHPTIEKLSAFLEGTQQQKESHPIAFNATADKGMVFAFPPISGWGVIYRNCAQILKNYQFYAFDFIETDNRIKNYAEQIQSLRRKHKALPCYLLGYSAGGNLAFEVVKQLEKNKHKVERLILLDVSPKQVSVYSTDNDLNDFAEGFSKFLSKVGFLSKISEISGNQHIDIITLKVKSRLLSYRKYLNSLVNTGRIQAKISVIKSNEGSESGAATWSLFTRKAVSFYVGSGDHLSMLEPEHIELNALLIEQILSQIGGALDCG